VSEDELEMMEFENNIRINVNQYLFVFLAAVCFGLSLMVAIFSDSPLWLLAVPGVFAGCLLFLKPVICFWMVSYGAMLAGVAVSYIPGMYHLPWVITLLSFLLGMHMILYLLFVHNGLIRLLDTIFLLLTAFLFHAIFISLLNGVSGKQLIISIKNYFQFYSLLLFFLCYPRNIQRFSGQLLKAFLLIALVQPVIAVCQYVFVVPTLSSLSKTYSTSVMDAVNGTFGTSLKGGGTGMYTLFTCTILCGLIAAYSKKTINRTFLILGSIYFLFPMLLNETKAAVLFLFVGSCIVIFISKQINVGKKITLFVLSVLMGVVMALGTLYMYSRYSKNVEEVIRETIAYNFLDLGYGRYSLNRFTSLTFWWEKNNDNLVALFLGHGLDATEEADNEKVLAEPGNVARKFPLYGTGLTMASRLLWETGVLGFVLFSLAIFIGFYRCCRLARSSALTSHEQLLALTTASGLGMTFLFLFYNNAFRTSQPANLFIMLMLGITICLRRKQKQFLTSQDH